MAAVPPAPHMPAPRPPTASYATYFDDNSNDVFSRNYTGVLAPYTVNIAGADVAPAIVRDLATNAKENGIPTAFIQAQDNGQCQVMIQLDKISSTDWDYLITNGRVVCSSSTETSSTTNQGLLKMGFFPAWYGL